LNTRKGKLIALVCFSFLSVLPLMAQASSDEKIEIEFVGFGTNPDFYGIVQKDDLAGSVLIVYQIGVPAPVASASLEGSSLKKALALPNIAPYGLSNKGLEGLTAAQGYSLVGTAVGNQFQISITNGQASVTLGYSPIVSDPSGLQFASVKIRNAYWTADGARVVVILHQKLSGEWGMDSDTIAAFTLAPAAPAPAPAP
jgi:hypothetical protein